jgi:DNA processing protein
LRKFFGSWTKAWTAGRADYEGLGFSGDLAAKIIARKSQINPEQSFAELARRNIELILTTDPAYPELLREISAAPPMLYVRGRIAALAATGLGVVGTRRISPYGRQVCEELATGLVQNNLSVISGLAFGVDAAILSAVVENGGSGIAVLASDLDDASIAPRSNYQLSQHLLAQGCLVSEYALGAPVFKQNFPIRNRIIAGLSIGTVVVEADLESGSLITANYALEQNREVFAVPGPIFSAASRGTNELIRKGAHVVTGIGSILEELNIDSATAAVPVDAPDSPEERRVLERLTREPTQIEDLIRELKIPAGQMNAVITILEMKGRIKNLGGAQYIKLR